MSAKKIACSAPECDGHAVVYLVCSDAIVPLCMMHAKGAKIELPKYGYDYIAYPIEEVNS